MLAHHVQKWRTFNAGFAQDTYSVARLLNKWQLKPDVKTRGKYKSIDGELLDMQDTRDHREATRAYLQSWVDQIVQDVAKDRHLSQEQVRLERSATSYCIAHLSHASPART